MQERRNTSFLTQARPRVPGSAKSICRKRAPASTLDNSQQLRLDFVCLLRRWRHDCAGRRRDAGWHEETFALIFFPDTPDGPHSFNRCHPAGDAGNTGAGGVRRRQQFVEQWRRGAEHSRGYADECFCRAGQPRCFRAGGLSQRLRRQRAYEPDRNVEGERYHQAQLCQRRSGVRERLNAIGLCVPGNVGQRFESYCLHRRRRWAGDGNGECGQCYERCNHGLHSSARR